MSKVGKNVEYEVKGKVLTITVDLSKEHGTSKSGKTITIASTQGNTRFEGPGKKEMVMGLNIYKYPEE